MNLKNKTKFFIHSLNQEKLLNEISKQCELSEIERHSKNETTFKCSYFEYKKVEKILKSKNVEIEKVKHQGIVSKFCNILSCYGLILAVVLFSVCFFLQSQFVWQYEIKGVEKLQSTEVVEYIKQNFPSKIKQIDTKDVEVALVDNFDEISFASCIIKGQTLVVSIKEKLLPNEMYGEFSPIISQKSGKITKIELVSGTLNVKVGDIVRQGDILVEPYTIDASGNLKKVEAQAKIYADVYNEGSVDHYDSYIDISRTGRTCEQSDITLFGLSIYSYKDDLNFELYETEYEDVDLIKNIFLPFKMRKTIFYELEEKVVQSNFEDVKEEIVQKAKLKALENCQECDKIKEEFYTIRHLSNVTIVNYCIITEEEIGVYKSDS